MQRENLFIKNRCVSTIIGRRNTFVVSLSPQMSERPDLLARGPAWLFSLFTEAFEDAVLAGYHSCLSLGAVVETPEISYYLNSPPCFHACSPFGWFLIPCSFWAECSAELEAQITVPVVYTDTTANWESGELWGSNEHWEWNTSLMKGSAWITLWVLPLCVHWQWTGLRLGYATYCSSVGGFHDMKL